MIVTDENLCLRTQTEVMATKTIGVTEEVYDRLAAEKRAEESFTDTVARLLDTATADWRHGFGRYGGEEGAAFERSVAESSADHADGLARSHDEVLGELGFELDDRGNVVSTPDDADDADEGR
jgi:predicted CopG family antitoxin